MEKTTFDPDFFWKNFRLGTELQIAGSFIYNALFTLDSMKTFHYEEECFEFLYHISIGLERLEKIAVILLEHDGSMEQGQFERSLITHNHIDLINRIKSTRQLKLEGAPIKFLDLLATFYKSTRYERYNFNSVYSPPQDQERLIKFISEELKIEIGIELPFSTPVSDNVKMYFGKLIGRITTQLFEIVKTEALKRNTYTYELSYDSKAFKIFIAKEFDFSSEKLMQREALLYVLKKLPTDALKKYIDRIDPLPLGNMHTNKYIESVMNFQLVRHVRDEIESIYEDGKIKGERVGEIMVIGSSIDFDELYFDEPFPN